MRSLISKRVSYLAKINTRFWFIDRFDTLHLFVNTTFMSQRNKLSLWQKFKRLLTASAPQSVVDAAKMPQHLLSAEDKADNNHKQDRADNKKAGNKDVENAKARNVDTKNTETSDFNDEFDDAIDNDYDDINNSERLATDVQNQKTEQDSNNDIPIVDYLKQYFDDKQWHYTHYQPRTNDSQQSHHLSLRMRNKQLECGYLFRVQEKNNLLAVYGILPFLIPESHQSAAMLLITQINYDMLIGNLEMDVNDGEIRYKNAIDVEAVGIDDHILEHLLQSVIAMTTVAYEIFDDLVNTQDPAEDMQTLLLELRQQSDARTFFLPTQFVQ